MQEYELEQHGMEGTVPFKRPIWWNYSISGQIHHSTLTWAEKYVYMSLHYYLSHDGSTCFPTVNTIAEATSLSRATVFRALKSLNEKKLIARHQQFDEKNGRQKPTFYEIFQIPDEILNVNEILNGNRKSESNSHFNGGSLCETGIKCAFTDGGLTLRREGGSHTETEEGLTERRAQNARLERGEGLTVRPQYQLEDLSKDVLEDTALRANTQSQVESGKQETKAKNERQEPDEKQELNATAFAETIPHSLKPIIDRFLTITGRRALKPQELKILEALSGYSEELIHQEISIAVGRFRRMNRPLHSLLLNYIVGSLSKKSKKTLPQGNVNQPDVIDVSGWEYADTRKYNKSEVKEFYGAGGWGNFEELKTLCEVCRLSECEISELYEELGIPAMKSA